MFTYRAVVQILGVSNGTFKAKNTRGNGVQTFFGIDVRSRLYESF